MDLLYLRHLSMHSDQAAACVLNIILVILGLHAICVNVKSIWILMLMLTFGIVHIHSQQCH